MLPLMSFELFWPEAKCGCEDAILYLDWTCVFYFKIGQIMHAVFSCAILLCVLWLIRILF